jgi:hypothetical protein
MSVNITSRKILQPETDGTLHIDVASSGFQILARRAFMALNELRNLGETFSHVLTSFANNPSQTICHIRISGNNTAQIVSWNSGVLTRTECLIHDEFSRVSRLYPHKCVKLSNIESHIQSHNAAVLVPRAGPL